MPGRSSHNQGNAVLSNIQAHSHLGYETVRKNPTSSASTANILKKNTKPKRTLERVLATSLCRYL